VTPLELDTESDAVLLDRDPGRKLRADEGRPGKSSARAIRLVDVDAEVLRPRLLGEDRQDRADPLIHARLKISTERTSSNRSTISPESPSASAWTTR